MNTNNYPNTKKTEDSVRRVSLSGKAASSTAVKPKEPERKPVAPKEAERKPSAPKETERHELPKRIETQDNRENTDSQTPSENPIINPIDKPVKIPIEEKPKSPNIISSSTPDNEPIICAVDHGYGNIKTSNFCFPANVTPCDVTFGFNTDVLIYEGQYYSIGIGHKEFSAEKILDQDYYILTLAAIGKELARRKLTTARIVIAAGLPLTWAEEQHERFRAYLMQKPHVDFTYKGTDFHVDIQAVFVFRQGIAAVANQFDSFRGTNMLVDIGTARLQTHRVCKSASRTAPVELEIRAARPTERLEYQ